MSWLRKYLGGFLALTAIALVPAALAAQEDAGASPESAGGDGYLAPIPEPPADGWFDRGRMLTAEQKEALTGLIARFRDGHDLEIYVAGLSFLLGEQIDEFAARLKESWVRTPRGVVIVYIRSTEQMTFAASESLTEFLPRDQLLQVFSMAAAEARATPDGAERPHGERILVAVDRLGESLQERIATREAELRAFKVRIWLIFAGFVGLLLVAGGIGWMLYRLHARAEEKSTEFYYFPPVVVGERFGARFGGGSVAVVDFRSPKREGRPDAPQQPPQPRAVHPPATAPAASVAAAVAD